MNGKMIVGIALIASIVAIALLAAPIQAFVNGTGNGDLLQTQEREKLRTQNCDCDDNGDVLQTQERERLKTQNRDCDGNCTQTQYRSRQRANECVTNRICNCTKNMEQYRNQNRKTTRKP